MIFVTGFDSPLTDTEVRFLADAARHAGKLFLVVNKRDLVSGRDADAVGDFVRRRLREDLGLSEPRLFGLSALEALEAAVQGDSERLSQDRLKTAQRRLEEAGCGIARGWLERRTGEVLELLTGMVAGQISVLLEAARSPGLAGAELAGVACDDDHRGPGGWTADDVPGLAAALPCLGRYARCLLAGNPFCGVEGLECLAGGVVVGAGAEGGADAVAVKLLAHRPEDTADGEADVSFAEVFDDAGEDRRRGEVDVADGRAVKNKPPQRASLRGQGHDVVDQAGGVGVVQAGAEPVDDQSWLGPRAGPDRGRLPVPGR